MNSILDPDSDNKLDARLPYRVTWRDRLAYRLASAALLLATPTYRSFLAGAWRLGLIKATELADEAVDGR